MKKIICLLLALCAACAFVHAGVADIAGLLESEEITLYLNAGRYVYPGPAGSLEDWYDSEIGRLMLTLRMIESREHTSCHEVRNEAVPTGHVISYSIDDDDTEEIIFDYNSAKNEYTVEAGPEPSCGEQLTYQITGSLGSFIDLLPVSEVNAYYVFKFYNPLTIVFSSYERVGDGYCEVRNGKAEYFVPDSRVMKTAVIPDTIAVGGRAVPVTAIEAGAFRDQKELTAVNIGRNIKEIGPDTFNGCVKLKSVGGGAGLERIGDSAFMNCKELAKFTVGRNVREIGKGAFQNCAKLKTVSGGAGLVSIGESAFAGCKKLAKFTIGAKVKTIGKKAFYKCAALKKLTIKSKLLTKNSVGASAFKGIYKKATVKVPKAVKKEYTKWLLKKGVKKTMKIK